MYKRYEEINFNWGASLEEAVDELLKYKSEGKSVCGEFNGVVLYSDTVTMDGAYKEIIGETKSEFDERMKRQREDYEKREKEYKERIPELSNVWMKKGREVLTEDKWESWDKIVPIRLNDLYKGMELEACLDIVSILNNNGTLDEAKNKISSQGHSGMSYGLVCSMVKEFCDRGNEFVEYIK